MQIISMCSVAGKRCLHLCAVFCFSVVFSEPAAGIQVTLTPGISVSVEYSDNLEQTETDKIQDYILLVSPNLALSLSGESRAMEIYYSPSYSMYRDYSEYNTFRHLGTVAAWSDISRQIRFNFDNSYIRTEEPDAIELETEGQPETTSSGREIYFTNNAHVDMSYQFNSYLGIVIGYDNWIYRNEDPEMQNIESHQPSVELNFWIVPNRTNGQLAASFTRADYTGSIEDTEFDDDYDNLQMSAALNHHFSRRLNTLIQYACSDMHFLRPNDDYRIHDFTVDTNYSHNRSTSFTFGIGYFIRDNELSDSESGLSLNMNINKSIRNGLIGLDSSVGYEESYLGDEILGFSNYYEIGFTLQYEFLRYLSGELFGSYRNEEWKDTEPERMDDTFIVGCGISRRLLRWLSLNGSYMYQKVDSNITGNSFEENRFIITVGAAMASPIRLWN